MYSFSEIEKLFKEKASDINLSTQKHIAEISDLSINDVIKPLDEKSRQILERESVDLANAVATFLKERDKDIITLSQQTINQQSLETFFRRKQGMVHKDSPTYYDTVSDTWKIKQSTSAPHSSPKHQTLSDNKGFHKVSPHRYTTKTIPLYKEVTFYTPDGQEQYKVSSLDEKHRNISDPFQTYLHAESYFNRAKTLKKGEIYVSRVIGAYVPSPLIGSFTKANARKRNISFQPKKYAYAGIENPVGKKFSGIIRYVTPIYQDEKLKGYLTMALDHTHIRDFVNYYNPLGTDSLSIPNAGDGNYAFMWDDHFRCISHPRDYFIVGFDPKTGKQVPGWIDTTMAEKFNHSKENNLNDFLAKQPPFLNQSLKKKPNPAQVALGKIGIDCRYLNFAPQCQGWKDLVSDGGHGSFTIYWSGIWKLTTASAIPYYTGDYGQSKIGFGFVTLGIDINKFHDAATAANEKITAVAKEQNQKIQDTIQKTSDTMSAFIQKQLGYMELFTLVLLILAIYVAILFTNYIGKRIDEIVQGAELFKSTQFRHRMKIKNKDEIGKIAVSFNTMADAITTLQENLQDKIYNDELTGLKNKVRYNQDVKMLRNPLLYLVDIDFFRNMNNFYGISAGDYMIQEVAKALSFFAEKNNMQCYRLGSDEFLMLEDTPFDHSAVSKQALNLKETITQHKIISQQHALDINLDISIGIAYGTDNILQKADLALSEAKRKKSIYQIYDPHSPNMNSFKENIIWRKKIQYAIENDKVILYYQPIIDLNNPNYKKYEVLLRIADDYGVILPRYFLAISKETKQYQKLSKIMIRKSFQTFANNDYEFSINLSIHDIENIETVQFLKEQIDKYKLGKRLTIELLETEEINNKDIMDFIESMSRKGVRIAIDDFGSGYSNFSYLLQMNPDFIKIDGSIIKNLTAYSSEFYIVEAIIKFASMLGIKTVAEHVSNQESLSLLQELQVDYYQGYLFSEPKPEL